jgi:hypothetical protein
VQAAVDQKSVAEDLCYGLEGWAARQSSGALPHSPIAR